MFYGYVPQASTRTRCKCHPNNEGEQEERSGRDGAEEAERVAETNICAPWSQQLPTALDFGDDSSYNFDMFSVAKCMLSQYGS